MTDEELITMHIEPGSADSEARLRQSGVPVWALIGQLEIAQGNVDQVAEDYAVSRQAVEAAVVYYRRHKAAIDARLLLNAL